MANPTYQIAGELGKGGFGVVYLLKSDNGPKLALKTIDLRKVREDFRDLSTQEAKILRNLSHPFLVHHVNSYQRHPYLCIITEFCGGGDLEKFVNSLGFTSGLPEKLITCWLMQTSSALNYMHTHSPAVLHRDLKPQNVYITENGDARVGDLGLARKMVGPDEMANTVVGTILYLSPEMLSQQPYNSKSDIWSLGCLFYDITGKKGPDDIGMMFLLVQVMGGRKLPLPDTYSEGLRTVITRMLTRDPKTRPSAANILASPVVREFQRNPQRPADIIAEHACRMGRSPPRLARDLSHLRYPQTAPLSSEEILIPRDALDALSALISTTTISTTTTTTTTTVYPKPPTMVQGMKDLKISPTQAAGGISPSPNSLLLISRAGFGGGGGAGGGVGGAAAEAGRDDGASRDRAESNETFYDDRLAPELPEDQLVLKIQHLQSECTYAFGDEILQAAYGVIANVRDLSLLKKQLEELLGKSMYGQYGKKILELRVLEYGLHKKTT